MDLLAQHEAFLRAIFDTPDDDTPRLVYADFLQENGDEDRAEFIRVQCEMWPVRYLWVGHPDREPFEPLFERMNALTTELVERRPTLIDAYHHRGFRLPGTAYLPPAMPNDPDKFREWVVFTHPDWFGATTLRANSGLLLAPSDIDHLLRTPAFHRVQDIDFSGHVEETSGGSTAPAVGDFSLIDIVQRPAVTTAAVEALARHRGARRITALNLTRNNLDNDAARALIKSPYLDNLKRLELLEGNRLRGKVWQQVIERFGEEVVG
jgi:uncharacterized protein (TIGR02996 family)